MARGVKRILLAEDDRATAYLTRKQLEQSGFYVEVAENGREALQIIRSGAIDLLITDVVMPEMDGVDLYLALKADPHTESLPIIIVTDKQMFKDSFAALGVSYFVPKLSDFETLLAKIREVGIFVDEKKNFRKVLISGSQARITTQIQNLLQPCECLTSVVNDPIEIVSKVLLMIPHIVLLDIQQQGDVSVVEIVRALRCFDRLRQSVILTYSNPVTGKADDGKIISEDFQERISECHKSGATRYLGVFSQAAFARDLREFGIE